MDVCILATKFYRDRLIRKAYLHIQMYLIYMYLCILSTWLLLMYIYIIMYSVFPGHTFHVLYVN